MRRRGFLAAAGVGVVGLAGGVVGLRRALSGGAGFAVPVDTSVHARTWMAWPDSSAIWGPRLVGVQANIALVARTVAEYEPVIVCANQSSVSAARWSCGSTVTVIGSIPVDDCWMRDTGPIFRTDGVGGLDVVGTNFNGWGGRQTHGRDALVASRVAGHLGVPFTAASFVGEGGAIETDGAGTLMATRSSLVNSDRNPGTSQAQIAAAMCAAYGASQVIWFTGIKDHDITDDHVDATSRFLGPAEALVQLPPAWEAGVWADDARQQYQALTTSRSANGVSIAVAELPGPDYTKIRSTVSGFVGSYANYYVCNGAVISAQFGDTEADAAAKTTLSKLFPGRFIEQLDIDHLAAGGGGIHCVTQQQPQP
jgi:agmatine deiminase